MRDVFISIAALLIPTVLGCPRQHPDDGPASEAVITPSSAEAQDSGSGIAPTTHHRALGESCERDPDCAPGLVCNCPVAATPDDVRRMTCAAHAPRLTCIPSTETLLGPRK